MYVLIVHTYIATHDSYTFAWCIICSILTCLMIALGDLQPKQSDLNRYIAPKYAARWNDLGVQLKVPRQYLDAIAADKTNHPSSEQCCKAMLQKWIEITPNATWNILQQSTSHLPDLASSETFESMHELVIINIVNK